MKDSRGTIFCAVLSACLVACNHGQSPQGASKARSWPPERPGYVNPIPAENALAGDPAWASGTDATAHEIEGYADRISVRAGDTVAVHASADVATTATWNLYRFGWYGGAGARSIRTGGPVTVEPRGTCPIVDPPSGLVRCSWPVTFTVPIGGQDVSGLYALKLVRQDGKTRFVPLVVVDSRQADLLLQASVQTYQAYNFWGGESLYRDASGTLPHGYASKVSFDRPFDDDRGLGQMLKWEVPMTRFLERYGYDVTFTTSVDVGTGVKGSQDPSRRVTHAASAISFHSRAASSSNLPPNASKSVARS